MSRTAQARHTAGRWIRHEPASWGSALTGQSWRVLRAHRELAVFPLIGALCVLLLAGPVFVPGAYLADRGDTAAGVALIAVGTYIASFLTTFFGVALAAAADRALRGEDPSVRDGAAWGVVTFLVIPLVALEGIGPLEGLKRSAALFKQHWGGQLTGMAAVGIGVFLVGILPSLALLVGGFALLSQSAGAGAALIVLGAIGLALSMLVGSALRQVLAVALYRFALDGQAVAGFSADDLQGAVRTK